MHAVQHDGFHIRRRVCVVIGGHRPLERGGKLRVGVQPRQRGSDDPPVGHEGNLALREFAEFLRCRAAEFRPQRQHANLFVVQVVRRNGDHIVEFSTHADGVRFFISVQSQLQHRRRRRLKFRDRNARIVFLDIKNFTAIGRVKQDVHPLHLHEVAQGVMQVLGRAELEDLPPERLVRQVVKAQQQIVPPEILRGADDRVGRGQHVTRLLLRLFGDPVVHDKKRDAHRHGHAAHHRQQHFSPETGVEQLVRARHQ